MEVFVKEYAWMWERLGLSLAECRVYAYIYGLTNSNKSKQKGYKGSGRSLAKMLGMNAGGTSVVLRKLQDKGLLKLEGDTYTSVESVNKSVESVNTSDYSVNTSDYSVNTSDYSVSASDYSVIPPTPPIKKEINKEMERNNKLACETLATPSPRTLSSFEELLEVYFRANGQQRLHPETINDARNLWDVMPEAKRRALLQAIRSGVWSKPRLDWTLSAFVMPQPTNYNGSPFPDGEVMVIAFYNGKAGVYTLKDAELFGMNVKKRLSN